MEHEFEETTITMIIEKIEIGKRTTQGYFPLKLKTNRGVVVCRYYHGTTNAQAAVIFVGSDKHFDSPARNLYGKLGKELSPKGINCLRIQYRKSQDLVESVMDVLIGIAFLERNGIKAIGLVGHAFGGAVVIQAAASSTIVRTVVTLATQQYGTDSVTDFHAQCSILLLHGTKDNIIPPFYSIDTYDLAHEPKEIILCENTGHQLNESANKVTTIIQNWLEDELRKTNAEGKQKN